MVVDRALATAFDLERHSLFQVSTSNALVQGVFQGAVTVRDPKRNGDFGLGTFDVLDGELIMLDGDCYRAAGGGSRHLATRRCPRPIRSGHPFPTGSDPDFRPGLIGRCRKNPGCVETLGEL